MEKTRLDQGLEFQVSNLKYCSGRRLLGDAMVLKARPSFSGPLRYAREPRRGRARPGVAWGGRWSRQVLRRAQYYGACTRASPARVRAVLRPWWSCMSVRPSRRWRANASEPTRGLNARTTRDDAARKNVRCVVGLRAPPAAPGSLTPPSLMALPF